MKTVNREIVSALIISKDNKILFGMKDINGGGVYSDCWHIPGGGIDKNESLESGLIREIYEEVGIDVSNEKIKLIDNIGIGESEKTDKVTGEKYLCKMKFNIYEVKINLVADEIKLIAGDDLKILKWVELDKLKDHKMTPPSVTLFKRLGYVG